MVSQHLSEGIHRISPLERDIDQYPDPRNGSDWL